MPLAGKIILTMCQNLKGGDTVSAILHHLMWKSQNFFVPCAGRYLTASSLLYHNTIYYNSPESYKKGKTLSHHYQCWACMVMFVFWDVVGLGFMGKAMSKDNYLNHKEARQEQLLFFSLTIPSARELVLRATLIKPQFRGVIWGVWPSS